MKAYLKGSSLYFKVSNVWVRTGVKCLPESWNQARQVIRASMPGAQLLNAALAKRKAELTDIILRLKYEKLPVTGENIERYNKPIQRTDSEVTVSSLLLRYADDHKKTLRKNYTRKFKPIAEHVEGFRSGILASEFSQEVLQEYLNHLLDLEDEDGEPLMTNNTLHDHVRKIRRVMQYYGAQGIRAHKDCAQFKFKYVTPKPVWNSAAELAQLETFIPLEQDQVYKDEHLFRCYTGLRFSDCQQLQPHHFISRGNDVYIDFTAIKTSLDQNILLSSKAAAIAKKWGYKVPKLYMQDCNERIKAICRGAKIKTKTEKVRFRGGERVVEVLEKWQLITTHVARRTFARMWLDLGGDVVKLMKYLGHSSTEQTLHYAGYETVEVNQEMKRLFG